MLRSAFTLCLLATLAGCSTSPLGRQQLKLMPDAEVQQMGLQSFNQMKKDTPISNDKKQNTYVSCVAQKVVAEIPSQYGKQAWEIVVFKSDDANAFALPGGKIGVYTGLLKVAKNQDQLAAVIGHEVGHVLAGHSNERLSTQYVTQAGLSIASAAAGTNQNSQQMLQLLGVGAQYGVILPFSRTQESEADLIGLDLMASAGFNPEQSISLWQNMSKEGGATPPELLSTHPAPAHRIDNLRARLGVATPLYQQARAQGKQPNCKI
ncbi:peptidase [Pokkaliibacter plantistimulans]|uniref:Peptidase n=1 Tax=Pokkaliibacter plantistimulans TaxID=1635171 RepID=A0ABX5LRA9_9GAMM|nr:M48 family metallopeptidase [Pokkaliibacter plantistimulans]PXF29200.1 peptidase [Pokkaliibacter plantistimulans]